MDISWGKIPFDHNINTRPSLLRHLYYNVLIVNNRCTLLSTAHASCMPQKYVYCTIFFFVCKLILILQFTRHVRKPFGAMVSSPDQTPQVPVMFLLIIHYFERPASSVRLVKSIHLRALLQIRKKPQAYFLRLSHLNVPEGIRTPDPRLRRPLLYPTELRTHFHKK